MQRMPQEADRQTEKEKIMPYSPDYIRKMKLKLLLTLESNTLFVTKGYKLFLSTKMLTSETYGGETDIDQKYMIVNTESTINRVLSIFVHECLHAIYPKYRENTVAALEDAIYADMAPAEKCIVLKALASNAEWGE